MGDSVRDELILTECFLRHLCVMVLSKIFVVEGGGSSILYKIEGDELKYSSLWKSRVND